MNHAPPQAAPHGPPPPEPGSHRYFTLLYTPAALRGQLATLLALADEIGTDPAIGADHSVAHARLAWWRREAERFAGGAPEHPWLRWLLSQQPQAALDLRALVDGAERDLAMRTLNRGGGDALPRAQFAAAAYALLAQDMEPSLLEAVGELGVAVQGLTRDPGAGTARLAARAPLLAIGRERQAPLTPLLVWLALAASGPRRGSRWRTALSDNLVAWSAARRAARGRFALS